MNYKLREYQEKSITILVENIRSGISSQLLCVPCGGGKTVIAAEIIRRAVKKGSKILFLAHRRELINQCAAKLESFGVHDYSVIMGIDKRFNPDAQVHVASVQSLIKREFPPANLIIIDECHRAVSKSYLDIIANYPNAKVLGLSATPERLDGKGLDNLFSDMVEVTTIGDLIGEGFLVKPLLYTGKLDSSFLAGVKKRQGDYAEGELQELMDTPKLIGDIVSNWKDKAAGRLTIVFASGVEHAEHIAREFFNSGITAAALHGGMPVQKREAIIGDWRKGYIKVVVNCMICTEGFDFPELECCVLARPTKSISLYLQMIGRIMRSAPGKSSALVLDHAGCIEEHGAPHIPREWTLIGEKERKKKENLEELKTCDSCDMIYNPVPKVFLSDVLTPLSSCPGCGNAVCVSCNTAFKLILSNKDIDGIAFTRDCNCPHCGALYTDDVPHMLSDKQGNELPESTDCSLTLYDSDELPLSVQVKNSFRKHLKTAQSKGYKRGYAFHNVVKEYGDEAKDLLPRHTAVWYRNKA